MVKVFDNVLRLLTLEALISVFYRANIWNQWTCVRLATWCIELISTCRPRLKVHHDNCNLLPLALDYEEDAYQYDRWPHRRCW